MPARPRLTALATLALAAAALAIAACATPTATPPAAPATAAAGATTAPAAGAQPTGTAAATAAAKPQAPSGTLTFANSQLPPNGDPYSSVGTTASFVFLTYSETLLRLDAQSRLAPGVAESWRTINPTTHQFTLRPNLRFHNGEPLNAQAIKFALDRAIAPDSGLALGVRFGTVQGAEVVDDRTVNIITRAPDPLLPRRMIELFTIPPAYFQQVGAQGFGQRPVGSGPWEVAEFNRERVVVRAVQNHFRTTAGVQEIRFVQLVEEASRMAALQAGDVQIAYALNPDSIQTLDRNRFDVNADPVSQYRALMMRTPTGAPLDNLQVRQAITHAVDQRAVANVGTAGLGQAATQLASPGIFGYNPDLQLYQYDLARARTLLGQAGYPNGFTTQLNYRRQFSGDGETAEAVNAMLAQVGINAQLQELENAVFSQRFSSGQLAPLAVMGIGTTPLLDADLSYQWYRTEAGSRFFANEQFDQVFAESRRETNEQRREQLLRQAARITYDQAAFVPLYTAINPSGIARNVTGFAIRLDGRADFEQVRINAGR